MTSRRFWQILIAIAVAAIAIRVGFVLGFKRHFALRSDNFVYHYSANLLVEGKGLINPVQYYAKPSVITPMADHPPAYWFYLAAWSLLGVKSILGHQLVTCLLGGAMVVLAGLLGRRLGSQRVGLIAAGLVAVYACLWINDALVMSESLAVVATGLLLLAAYRLLDRPSVGNAALLGLSCGFAALCRAELLLFLPIAALPVLVRIGRRTVPGVRFAVKRTLTLAIVVGVAAGAVMAPWIARNLTSFKEPVYLSTGLGITLAYSNCDETYYGDFLGSFNFFCPGKFIPGQDPSIDDIAFRKKVTTYVSAHKSRVPVVLAARFGRLWNLYRPGQQIEIDALDDRNRKVSLIGLTQYYAMLPFAIGGALLLRRRKESILPLIAIPISTTFAVLLTFGMTRYRVPSDFVMCVLAALGANELFRRVRRPRI